MSPESLARRPWLLVWAAFLLLIAGWAVTIYISGNAATQHLTPAQEEHVLLKKRR